MKTKEMIKKEEGITLVALIITIVVLVILVAVTIKNTMDSNLIETAEEATIRTTFSQIAEEYEMYVASRIMEDIRFDKNTLNAYENSLNYNTKKEEGGNIETIFSKELKGKLTNFEVTKGNLMYRSTDERLIKIAEECGILVNPYEIQDDGVLLASYVNRTLTEGTRGILTIPDTVRGIKVTAIGEGAFSKTEGITEIILPSGVKEIQKQAFRGNTEIKRVDLPEGLEKIGEYAFADCTALEEIIIPDTVTDAGRNTFWNCNHLTSVKLSKGITKIQAGMLAYTAILEVEIPEAVTVIEDWAFGGCNLQKLKISKNVSTIYTSGFPIIKEIELDNNNSHFIYTGGILANVEGTQIIAITDTAYTDNGKTLIIPPRIENLDVSIQWGVTKLRLPPSLSYINASRIPSTVVTVELYDENGITVNETANLSNKNGQICSKDGTRLYYCNLIYNDEIILNEGITVICGYALMNCNSAKNIIFPETLVSINWGALSGLGSLSSVSFGKNLTNISPAAFEGNQALRDVKISEENNTFISENGAIYTKNGNGNKEELVAFINTSAEIFVIPEGVSRIKSFSFCNKWNLKSIELSNTITHIEGLAFNNCGIRKITIPSSIVEIGDDAFKNATDLQTVEIQRKKNAVVGSPWGHILGNTAIKWTGNS